MNKKAFIIITAALILFSFLFLFQKASPQPLQIIQQTLNPSEFDVSQTRQDFDISKLKQGCPVRDCIPSIDRPKFITASQAEKAGEISDNDIVFGAAYKQEAKAYPQKILNWHEIVNDNIGGDPILISFCPLCGTAIGFIRQIEIEGKKETVEFGVSGKLVNSNLVMYDRRTQTLWQQLGGEAIVGQLAGQKLEPFPLDTLTWGEWKKLHPDTLVLSQDTGFSRDYNTYPYGSYEVDEAIYFPVEHEDDRLPRKQIVWGVIINGTAKAYSDRALAQNPILKDTVGGQNLTITRNSSGQVRITTQDGSAIIPERSMWFAWVAFHPDTELFQ